MGVEGLWPDAAADADHTVTGPLRQMVTSPLRQLAADREQVLSRALPTGFLPLTLAGVQLDVPVDSSAVERLVDTAYRLNGWELVDELRWQLFVARQPSRQLDPSRIVTAEALDAMVGLAADRLRGRVGRALAEADRQVRATVLAALARSAEEATPQKVGLIRKKAGWRFQPGSAPARLALEHARRCAATRKEEQRIRALYVRAVNEAVDDAKRKVSEEDRHAHELLDGSREPRLRKALRESEAYQAALTKAVETRTAAAKAVWLLDRCADELAEADGENEIAEKLGRAAERVAAANEKLKVAIEAAGPPQDAGDAGSWARSGRTPTSDPMPWLDATRPERSLAASLRRELGAWHYPILVEAALDGIGFTPGTFGWIVVQYMLDELRFWESRLDELLEQLQLAVGLAALVPPLRPPAAAALALVAAIRLYRRWTSPTSTEWWALIDPSSSLQAHPPSMISILVDSGFDVLDVAQVVPVSKILASAKRLTALSAVVAVMSGSGGPAADLARAATRGAEIELVRAVAEGRQLYAEARAATEAPPTVGKVAAVTEAAPARPRPSAPPNPFDEDLPKRVSELARRIGELSAAQEQAAAQASRREIPLPAEEPKRVSTPRVPKRRPKRRPRLGPLQQKEKQRAKAGVKLGARILVNRQDVTLATGRRFDEIELVVGDSLDKGARVRYRFPRVWTLVDPDVAEALRARGNKRNPFGLNWLHGAGLTWGVDVKPRFLGPQSFNASAQARIENIVRRLKGSYLSEGRRIVVNVRQYGFRSGTFANAERFIEEVRYEVWRMDPTGRREWMATVALKASDPHTYAFTGQIYASTDPIMADVATVAEDILGSAADWSDPLKKFQ